MVDCRHHVDDVKWDSSPGPSSFEAIEWHGTCKCGKRVYECYFRNNEDYAYEELG